MGKSLDNNQTNFSFKIYIDDATDKVSEKLQWIPLGFFMANNELSYVGLRSPIKKTL
jgi:hypothetical protein